MAAARLGLQTCLIAAVANDRFGDEIVEYLEDQRVDTSLIKRVPNAETPFAGVFQQQLGDSLGQAYAAGGRLKSKASLDLSGVGSCLVRTVASMTAPPTTTPRPSGGCSDAASSLGQMSRPVSWKASSWRTAGSIVPRR